MERLLVEGLFCHKSHNIYLWTLLVRKSRLGCTLSVEEPPMPPLPLLMSPMMYSMKNMIFEISKKVHLTKILVLLGKGNQK